MVSKNSMTGSKYTKNMVIEMSNDIDRDVSFDLKEWNDLIIEYSEKEIALYKWKQVYDVKANEIIEHTDFKELYGANNQKVRDNHVRNELTDWYEIIKDLEFSLNYINHRISFLKELIRTKRMIMEVNRFD